MYDTVQYLHSTMLLKFTHCINFKLSPIRHFISYEIKIVYLESYR